MHIATKWPLKGIGKVGTAIQITTWAQLILAQLIFGAVDSSRPTDEFQASGSFVHGVGRSQPADAIPWVTLAEGELGLPTRL